MARAAADASRLVAVAAMLNERELAGTPAGRRPLAAAARLLGGARVDDARGARRSASAAREFVVVLVSEFFAGVPWLERVYQAASLWDAAEMGAQADVHCYTPGEFARKRETLPVVGGPPSGASTCSPPEPPHKHRKSAPVAARQAAGTGWTESRSPLPSGDAPLRSARHL